MSGLQYLRAAHARRVLAALLLVGVLFRALIPAGLMPDLPALAHGRVQLVICTGTGPMVAQATMMPGQDHGAPPAKHQPAGQAICPFALAVALAGPVILPVLLALIGLAAAPAHAACVAAWFARATAPWHARGPPAFA